MLMVFVATGISFAKDNKEVPPVMYQFLTKMVALADYLYYEEAFLSPVNEKTIESNLSELKTMSKELKHHKRLQTPGYEQSADYFIQNMGRAHDAFKDGKKRYAWRLFRSTLHACSSCHTQEQSKESMSWNLSNLKLPDDPYERGQFYFTIRGYDQAWAMFAEVIDTYGRKHKNNHYIDVAMDRMLIIALRMKREPKDLITYMDGMSNRSLMPKYFQDQLKLWEKELKNMGKLKEDDLLDQSPEEMEVFIDDLYREVYPFPQKNRSQKVVMEYATGLMFEYMNNRPNDVTQKMLYWLGISNVALDQFESSLMGEKFLQHCIEDYNPSLVSYQCYNALEDQWIIGFSGSSGIYLPMDLEEKLASYRKKLNLTRPWLN